MDILRTLVFVRFMLVALFVAAPIAMGAYMLLFSRRFSLAMYRYRKAVWKIGFTDFDVRLGKIFTRVVGAVLLIGGLITGAQFLLDSGVLP
jgi:hypothetical protein